jgi:hypothetical protein
MAWWVGLEVLCYQIPSREDTVASAPDDIPFPALLLNPHPTPARLLASLLLRDYQVPAPPETGQVLETATQMALDQREAMHAQPS